MEQREPESQPEAADFKPKKSGGKGPKVLFAVIVLILVGLLAWLWVSNRNTKADLEDKNRKLQGQVNNLEKELAKSKKSADGDAGDTCTDATDDFRDTIADAVTSQNYAALEAHMTNPITVVYAATEFGGPKTPAEAVTAMDYLNSGAAPWDFDLTDAQLDEWRSGPYEQYVPEDAFAGQSSDGVFVSFVFECGKISQVFIAASGVTP